ncbi:aminoacylase 1-like protein 2 [Dichomitus squalens]|uniref:Peptidase M20 domain-containing protein 2 n=1 Tax=Dichomitus squalens TaxID=114155 RepID=A0A4Q9PYI1_9APHY|nr:aminoacylase 1-like protein 2 [Dichomitus squalens]
MAQSASTVFWQPGDKGAHLDRADVLEEGTIYRPEFFEHVQATLKSLDQDLIGLSKDIHDHPELKFEERHAHDTLTTFVEKHGFHVTRHHWLETAWLAKFTKGNGGRTLVKSAIEHFDISGTVVLLGTPAEEGGAGKVILLERGAYDGMDACLMCHPAPGPRWSTSLSSCLALQRLIVEFSGHTAHAALSPWEGQNALDAAVLAYTNISVLRQQLKPSHRVHGIFEGKDWAPNIIPDYSKMIGDVRAPTRAEVESAVPRVTACYEAAGVATGCKVKLGKTRVISDLRQNKALSDECADIFSKKFGPVDYEYGIKNASTDFGNITYALPSFHPSFTIPTRGSNHTPEFAEAAATEEAHKACINMSITLAANGLRLLTDDAFANKASRYIPRSQVKKTFEEDKVLRDAEAAQA